MSALLIVHLGAVLALFVTLPYGKFVHGIYRTAALINYAMESRRTEGHGERREYCRASNKRFRFGRVVWYKVRSSSNRTFPPNLNTLER